MRKHIRAEHTIQLPSGYVHRNLERFHEYSIHFLSLGGFNARTPIALSGLRRKKDRGVIGTSILSEIQFGRQSPIVF